MGGEVVIPSLRAFTTEFLAIKFSDFLFQVPNYYRMIANPMDFSTIRGKLTKSNFHHYQCLDDFIADVRLVFANCQKFNHASSLFFCLIQDLHLTDAAKESLIILTFRKV